MRQPQDRFRILSLDGGGVRGYLSAAILEKIESYLNTKRGRSKALGECFDLIVGTSTGGIIALALASGRNANETAEFCRKYIPLIFGSSQRRNKLRACISPKYSSEKLKAALEDFFGMKTLGDTTTDVCVTGVSLQNATPRFYKSDYLTRNASRLDEALVDIALGTSAAPTYFRAHSMKHSNNVVDGGLCANNPAMIGLVDSFQFERLSKRGAKKVEQMDGDVMMLSIGTGEQPSMPYDVGALEGGGWIDWAVPITEVLFESQAQLIHYQAKFLLGERYFRVNPRLKSPMALDDCSKIGELKNLEDMTGEIQGFIDREELHQ